MICLLIVSYKSYFVYFDRHRLVATKGVLLVVSHRQTSALHQQLIRLHRDILSATVVRRQGGKNVEGSSGATRASQRPLMITKNLQDDFQTFQGLKVTKTSSILP